MAKRDTKKVSRMSIRSQEWALDIPPHNSIKKHKAKERQDGKKEIKKEIEESLSETGKIVRRSLAKR